MESATVELHPARGTVCERRIQAPAGRQVASQTVISDHTTGVEAPGQGPDRILLPGDPLLRYVQFVAFGADALIQKRRR